MHADDVESVVQSSRVLPVFELDAHLMHSFSSLCLERFVRID